MTLTPPDMQKNISGLDATCKYYFCEALTEMLGVI